MRITSISIAYAALILSAGVAMASEIPRSFDQAVAAEHCANHATKHAGGAPKGALQQAVYDESGKRVGSKPVYSVVRSGGKVVGYNPACGGH